MAVNIDERKFRPLDLVFLVTSVDFGWYSSIVGVCCFFCELALAVSSRRAVNDERAK